MATALEIKGPTRLDTGGVDLGQTDATDVPSWDEMVFQHPIFTNASGPNMPVRILNMGRMGIVTANLIDFDIAALEALLKAPGATLAGQLGKLGASYAVSPGVGLFPIAIKGSVSGSRTYSFATCFITDAIRDLQWGIMENKKALTFHAIPDPTALATATTPIWTAGTVT